MFNSDSDNIALPLSTLVPSSLTTNGTFIESSWAAATTPSAIVAGVIVTSASLDGIDPAMQWILSIVAGGGIAGTIQLGTAVTRAASSATTGGIGNPVVSTVEAGASVLFALLAILVPIVAAILVVGLMILAIHRIVHRRRALGRN